MRKSLILFLVISSSLVFMAGTCEKENDAEFNQCEATEQPQISRSFVFSANILYKDMVPYEGEVHFKIKKEYCDNTISGEYHLDHIPSDAQGDWFSGMVYTYEFANENDRIIVYLTWANNSKDVYLWDKSYYYANVVNYPGTIEQKLEIILPWNSK